MTHESKYIFIAAAVVALVLSAAGAPAAAADVAASRPATRPGAGLPPKTVKAVKALLAKAELVVLGKVAAVHDRTAKDAGMLYDVTVDKILKGKWQKKSLSFRSTGWVGYAKYTKGQRVLLFLRRWGDKQDELLQLRPVVYLSPPQPGGLDLRPVEKYLKLIKSLPPGGDKLPTERAKLLKKHIGQFTLAIRYYGRQDKDKPYYSLTLRVPVVGDTRTSIWPAVQISKPQTENIIEHLDRTGILAAAGNLHNKGFAPPKGPTYALTITGPNELRLYEPLGWDLKMLKRLDALRKVLDGDAAKAMDTLLKALEPQRKIWRQLAASFAKRIKASKRALNLVLRHHPVDPRQRNTYPNLHLYWAVDAPAKLPAPMIGMSKREAFAAIDALDKTGYFELAGDVTARRAMRTLTPWPVHKGPCYSLTVSSDNLDCHANLGWNLKMLECLDALRKAFDKGSDAGKAMDKVLKALAPQRKIWRKKAAATQPGKAARRIQVVRDRIDSLELSIRHHGGLGDLCSLNLRVSKDKYAPRDRWLDRVISPQTAGKLVDVLARDGFFARAEDIKGDGAPRGTYYAFWLRVHGKQRVFRYREIMAWDLKMLERLDALRKVLDGEVGMAMDKLLKGLKPHREQWEKAASDPKFVQAHAREVEREFRKYLAKRKAGLQAEYCAWLKGRQAIGPLMLPYLLGSTDVGVKHHGLILARDYYGSGKIVPNAIAVLEELLKAPRDLEASTRMVACQVLGKWPDVRSLPVLLKALDDPWLRHKLVGGPRGHASHLYQTVWWEADKALRAITGASPVRKPLTHVGPEPGDRKAASAAWKKWWAENKDKLSKGPKGERVVVQLPKSGPPVLVNRGPGTIWYASSVMEMRIRYVTSEPARSIPSHLKDRIDPRRFWPKIIRKTKRVEAGFAHTAHWTRAKKTSQWPAQLGGRVLQVKWLPLKPGGSIEAKLPFITTRQRALNTIPAPWWTPKLGTTGPVFVTARVRKDPADPKSEIVVKSNSREAKGPELPPLRPKPTTRKAVGGPASGPAPAIKRTAERAKLLKKRVDSFRLTLRWHTTQGKSLSPGQSLQLTTLEADYKPRPFWATVVISKQRAGKIIEHLAAEGFLERASDVKPAKSYPVPKLKSYSLTVRTSPGPHLYEHMPWELNLLKRVESLRKIMVGNRDAVRVIDKILAPLKMMPATGAARSGKAPGDMKVQQVCMAALRKMRKDFTTLATKYPKDLGHLGPPAIDEKKLLLRFPVKDLPKTTQPARRATSAGLMRSMRRRLRPGELGLFVQFTVPISKRPMARWLYSNVGFSWRWMWPNRSFSWKAQQDLMKMLNQALAPLNELENAMVAADLARRKTGAFLLRGRPGVKLSLRLAPKRAADGSAIIDLYATNETKKVLALCPPFPQVIGDGKPWHYRASDPLPMLIRAFSSRKDPFIYIKPGQRAKVGAIVAAGLSPGRHTVRVAVCHARDTWIDQSPVAYDGPPITHKVPGAWTGVLVSGELAIDIPAPAATRPRSMTTPSLRDKSTIPTASGPGRRAVGR